MKQRYVDESNRREEDVEASDDFILNKEPPLPWRYVTSISVGGVRSVGFIPQRDILLVISVSGAGLFDTLTGIRLFRDSGYDSYKNELNLEMAGIGDYVGQLIRVAGLFGGGLKRQTVDGWSLNYEVPRWPRHLIHLIHPWKSGDGSETRKVKLTTNGACELRAFGFSDTGQSIVVATTCGIDVFARKSIEV